MSTPNKTDELHKKLKAHQDFDGKISREEAEKNLKDGKKEQYLRQRSDGKGYALSFIDDSKKITHLKIDIVPEGYLLEGVGHDLIKPTIEEVLADVTHPDTKIATELAINTLGQETMKKAIAYIQFFQHYNLSEGDYPESVGKYFIAQKKYSYLNDDIINRIILDRGNVVIPVEPIKSSLSDLSKDFTVKIPVEVFKQFAKQEIDRVKANEANRAGKTSAPLANPPILRQHESQQPGKPTKSGDTKAAKQHETKATASKDTTYTGYIMGDLEKFQQLLNTKTMIAKSGITGLDEIVKGLVKHYKAQPEETRDEFLRELKTKKDELSGQGPSPEFTKMNRAYNALYEEFNKSKPSSRP